MTVPVVVQTSSQPERQTISQSVVHTSDTISTPSVTMPSITNADEDIPETTYTEIPPTTAILETTTEEIIPETTNTSETTETTVPETTNMSEITSAPADSTQPS